MTIGMKNMKQLSILLFTLLSCFVYGQDKFNHVYYNKLTEVTGTNYVIATIENRGKMEINNQFLLFINTQNGNTKKIDFPKDAYISKIEQIKIDTLGINLIFVAAHTVNLDGNKGIDWNDPKQIIIFSTDGQERTQLTDDKFFVGTWIINKQTGTLVITGYYDSNNSGKYDKTDKNEILLYNLKTLKLISKF
jgi:hypothetical protein